MIAFDNAAYSYGGGELLSELSLRLAPGSFHFLTGPSGAGKTSLLRLMLLSLQPTRCGRRCARKAAKPTACAATPRHCGS